MTQLSTWLFYEVKEYLDVTSTKDKSQKITVSFITVILLSHPTIVITSIEQGERSLSRLLEINFPERFRLQIPFMKRQVADIGQHDGIGVQPDYVLEEDWEVKLAGEDQACLQVLKLINAAASSQEH